MAYIPHFIYVDTINGRDKYYQFWADEDAYNGIKEALGIVAIPPEGADAVTVGTFADYPIVRVRLSTLFKELCSPLCCE